MSHSIDPVNAFYEGINSVVVTVSTAFTLFGFAYTTNWAAHLNVPLIPPTDFVKLPGGIVAMMQIGWITCLVGWIACIYLLATAQLPPRYGLFGLYTFACGIWAPFGMAGDYWWLPILIFLSVAAYYWFGFGILMRQINRRWELDQD